MTAPRFGDVDGDGDEDLVFTNALREVLLQRSSATGFVGLPAPLFVAATTVRDLYLADADGDQDLDLFVASLGGNTSSARLVEVHVNDGHGAFTSGTTIVAPQNTGFLELRVADVDGDRAVELVGLAGGAVVLYGNDGAGVFAAPTVIDVPSPQQPWHIELDDLDGDQDVDVLVSVIGGAPMRAYLNDGAGAFGPAQTRSTTLGLVNRFRVADVDRDGLPDIVTTTNLGLELFLGLGGGTSGPALLVDTGTADGRTLRAADVDGDGDQDLLFSGISNAEVELIESFTAHRIGVSFCGPAVASSSGLSGVIEANGSLVVAANDVRLRASQLPGASVGFFLASRSFAVTFPVPGSQGRLCLGSRIGRFVGPGQVLFSGLERQVLLRIDLTRLPSPTGPIMAVTGETWGFQTWFRDVHP